MDKVENRHLYIANHTERKLKQNDKH